jgi:hypothetical protein
MIIGDGKRLKVHGVQLTTRAATYDNGLHWYFFIPDPRSARETQFSVPVGTSESAILAEAYKVTSDAGPSWGAWAFLH